MRKFLNSLYLICGVLSAVLIVFICGLVFLQVLFNLIVKAYGYFAGTGISLSISSYGKIAGYMLASASFLALPYTFQKGGHIRMTLVYQSVGVRTRYVFDVISVLFAAVVAVYLTYDLARLTYDSYQFNDLSEGIVKIAIWIPQIVMTFGMAILAIALIDAFCSLLMTGSAAYTKSKDTSAEGSFTS
ncbi:MAG: TRAP transporter small permease [Methyloligellaceae bacterium]